MSDPLQVTVTDGGMKTRVKDLIGLLRVRLNLYVLVTTLIGMYLAHLATGAPISFWLIMGTALGAGFAAFGSSALNMWMEREVDAQMNRTKNRPIPAGRVQPQDAVWVGVVLIIIGLVVISAAAVNWVATAICGFTALSYLFMYTPLKRVTTLALAVGAIPGALPPVLGWAAVAGSVTGEAWLIFGLLFLWQLPHFLALSWKYREDYARGGFVMLTVQDPDGAMVGRQMVLQTIALMIVSAMPFVFGYVGPAYLATALVLGTFYLVLNIRFLLERSDQRARVSFLGSLLYIPAVLGVQVLDRLLDPLVSTGVIG